MRKFVLALIVVLGFGCTWLALRKPPSHDQNLKSYFQSGSSLKAGAPVCVDGVKLGVVKSVRVRPELGDRPVEVLMSISTPYELRIPNDSTVLLSAEGVLGETYAEIDTRNAQGPTIGNDGVLKSSEVSVADGANAIRRVGDALVQATVGNSPPGRKSPGKPADSGAK
jgi:ABC-type transporter Mla subunit MlaD